MNYQEKNAGFLTHSKLQAFRFCQMYYYLKYEENALKESKSDALLMGTAFDLREQGSEKFDDFIFKNFHVGERRSKQGKIDCEIAESEGKAIITNNALSKMREQIEQMYNAMTQSELYIPLGNPQERIEIEYKGIKLAGDMDDLQLENKLIIDTKTVASVDFLKRSHPQYNCKYREYYKMQLAFYQLLVELKHGVACDGILKVVSKEETPRTIFFKESAESLKELRGLLLELIERYITKKESGKYSIATMLNYPDRVDYFKCCNCPAYGVCKFGKQDDYFSLDDF